MCATVHREDMIRLMDEAATKTRIAIGENWTDDDVIAMAQKGLQNLADALNWLAGPTATMYVVSNVDGQRQSVGYYIRENVIPCQTAVDDQKFEH
jgi:hypothetical protein